MSTPLISVIIPTYFKPESLKLAIKSVLNQDFNDFELIIIDDGNDPLTKKTVEQFNNKKIIFIVNKKNLGVALTVKNGFKVAEGKYVFFLGDDDVILKRNTLSVIYKEMERTKAGYCQIGYLYFENNIQKPSFINNIYDKSFFLPATEDILIKTLDWHFGSMAGSIFKRDLVRQDDIIDDVWWIYFTALYRIILSTGCLYLGDHFILAKISVIGNIAYVDVKKNKQFYMLKLFKIFKHFDKSPEHFKVFLKYRLDIVVNTLPGIKFYSSTQNIIAIIKEIITLRKEYLTESHFWINSIIAVLCPKFILLLLRKLRIVVGSYRITQYLTDSSFNKHIEALLKS